MLSGKRRRRITLIWHKSRWSNHSTLPQRIRRSVQRLLTTRRAQEVSLQSPKTWILCTVENQRSLQPALWVLTLGKKKRYMFCKNTSVHASCNDSLRSYNFGGGCRLNCKTIFLGILLVPGQVPREPKLSKLSAARGY